MRPETLGRKPHLHRGGLPQGPAGTGKSVCLRRIAKELSRRKRVVVTASTGIAAEAVSGVTLHSWAGCGVPKTADGWYKTLHGKEAGERIRGADVLLIEEVHGSPLVRP